MRRISWRRVDSDSVPNCWTMRRSADWRRSGSCSLFAPNGAEFEANAEALAAEGKCAGRAVSASEAVPAVRKPDAALGAEADCAGPSTGTIEASGLAV